MKCGKTPTNVFVAMSGGVDSSVAALLLVRAGYHVTGVFMRPWQPPGMPCLWEVERADALRVAAHLGIPLETWDVSGSYARHVSRPMVTAYRRGMTPNPDVECNRYIKFGVFYREARARGADFIATGHYARTGRQRGTAILRRSADAEKDQTYFLWRISASQLPRILFPVGMFTKPEVRAIARRARLPVADKKDSQGVCFVGPLDMKQFLSRSIRHRRGRILDADGYMLGEHDGAGYYTIGQRHGLDIRSGGGPYYVISKDMRRNTVTVGPAALLDRTHAVITAPRWMGAKPARGALLRARIRHRGPLLPVRLNGRTVTFLHPARAIAPGQSIVFYHGTRLAGGAVFR